MKSEETRWLTDSEQDLWRTLREFLWQFPSAMDRQMLRDSNMQSGEYSVLAVLSETAEPSLRPADVATVALGPLAPFPPPAPHGSQGHDHPLLGFDRPPRAADHADRPAGAKPSKRPRQAT